MRSGRMIAERAGARALRRLEGGLAPTLRGLARVVTPADAGPARADAAAAALAEKIRQMPPHMRIGIVGLTLAFERDVRLRGPAFARLDLADQRAALERWRNAPLGPCRQFAQFYEKMGLFLYYSLLEEEIHPPVEVR